MSATRGVILVADDEKHVRDVCVDLLEAEGFEVHSAVDGEAALALIEERHFDAVLSDIVMPGLTGVELLRSVRKRELDVPFVLMTGDPRVETAVEAVELGAVRYLRKPLSPDELTSVVGHAVSLSRLAAAKRDALLRQGEAAQDRLIGDRAGLEGAYALACSTLWMAFQPIVSAADRTVFGYEALLRSGHAPLLSAGAFLEAAQRLGRMEDLGRSIRERLAILLETGFEGTLFVNLSPADLMDATLYAREGPLSPFAHGIVLEITERETLEGVDALRSRVRSLKELGYRLAVDDLGAGYAGLTSFATLEPEVVKLDRSLVVGVDKEPIQRRLITSIVGLCRDLGSKVVAEGVETASERDALAELGCDLLQGYLFGRPGAWEDLQR
jgi:EAL domain-containing protein (putative c-di-GMP-specific phosphodiesterase class I)